MDIFDTAGKLIKRLTKDIHLKGPSGVALAPKNFGPPTYALLVGNLGDGPQQHRSANRLFTAKTTPSATTTTLKRTAQPASGRRFRPVRDG